MRNTVINVNDSPRKSRKPLSSDKSKLKSDSFDASIRCINRNPALVLLGLLCLITFMSIVVPMFFLSAPEQPHNMHSQFHGIIEYLDAIEDTNSRDLYVPNPAHGDQLPGAAGVIAPVATQPISVKDEKPPAAVPVQPKPPNNNNINNNNNKLPPVSPGSPPPHHMNGLPDVVKPKPPPLPVAPGSPPPHHMNGLPGQQQEQQQQPQPQQQPQQQPDPVPAPPVDQPVEVLPGFRAGGTVFPSGVKPVNRGPAVFTRGGPGADEPKAAALVESMHHAWDSYEHKCWGQDELFPVSGKCGNWLHLGLTIIDSLDTMWIMGGFEAEYARATNWLINDLNMDQPKSVSFFETIIRMLGGFLSAYDMTQNDAFLEHAIEIGDRMLPAFNTEHGLPLSTVNLRDGRSTTLSWTRGAVLLAEIGTIQLEYFTLAHYTGNYDYYAKAQKVIDILDEMTKEKVGLYPMYIDHKNLRWNQKDVSFGAMGDSFYEYLLKMWLLTGKTNEQYLRMYRECVEGMYKHLYFPVMDKNVAVPGKYYIAELGSKSNLVHKMDHLACFVPGMLALGVHTGASEPGMENRDMNMAKTIMNTCVGTYQMQPSGIGAEYTTFTNAGGMKKGNSNYHLRPETVESLFVMWRVTHQQEYRDWGWDIYQAIEKHCRIPTGYTGLVDVTNPSKKQDKMESFFMAETLKYLYLLFENDQVINIDEWVFNTESHPVRIHQNDYGLVPPPPSDSA